jgi:hypothetical protein
MTSDSLRAYITDRETLLAEIIRTLSADERFVAAWLAGSFGRDDADAVSDLDLTVVVSDSYSERLCARPRQISAQTTKERFDMISKFGQPAVLYENNHNAPEGGTSTFVLYAKSAVMIDWILSPLAKAECPAHSLLLFDKVGIPLSPPPEPESLERCIERASDTIAFFWMMTAVTAKYIFRQDGVFVQCWLEELHKMMREVEYLIEGRTPPYQRGSVSPLAATPEGQVKAIYHLSERMLKLMPEVAKLGGYVPPSPMPTIEILLNLAHGK